MKTRIWYQSFLVADDVPAYMLALRKRIEDLRAHDTEVVMHGFIPGTFAEAYPGADLPYKFLFDIHGLQWAAAALEAERQGFDAFVIAPVSSPMVREIRTLVDIPVIGYGDAAFRMAGLYGRKFGFVLFNIDRSDYWPERMRDWGLGDSFVGLRPSDVSFAEVQGAFSDPAVKQSVIERVIAACERMVVELGADVIIPGEMPLNLLLSSSGICRAADATILDGLGIALKMAETAVELRRKSGMWQSRRGYFHAAPDKERVRQVLRFYGLDGLGERIPTI